MNSFLLNIYEYFLNNAWGDILRFFQNKFFKCRKIYCAFFPDAGTQLTWELAVEFQASWSNTRPCSKLTSCCVFALQTIVTRTVDIFSRQSDVPDSQRFPLSSKECVDIHVCIFRHWAPEGYIINSMLIVHEPQSTSCMIRAGTTCTVLHDPSRYSMYCICIQSGYPV